MREGLQIGPFLVEKELGAGAMGAVYRGIYTKTGQKVAIKIMAPGLGMETGAARFEREAAILKQFNHPNIVRLFGVGKHLGTRYYAMEYVEGEPLARVIERIGTRKVPDWRFTLGLGVQIARALETAHAKHVVHGNVAPESILIRAKDKVAKLGDMMLAKVFERIKAKQTDRPGEPVGNVAYLAPERTRSDVEPDTRADIYGLGATLYALLTGKPPFQGKTLVEIMAQIRQADPVPPKKFQDSIPDKFQDAVMTMLAKRPELRFQSPAQVARALEQVAKSHGMTV